MVKINIYILIFFDSEQTWTGADMPSPDIMWVSTLATPHLASIAQQRPALCTRTWGGGGRRGGGGEGRIASRVVEFSNFDIHMYYTAILTIFIDAYLKAL